MQYLLTLQVSKYCLCRGDNVGIVNLPAYIGLPVYRQVCGRPIILYTLSFLLSQHRAASPVGVPTCDYVIGYTLTWQATDCGLNLFIFKYLRIKGVVNCQNTRDNVVPRIQQWPLDIPQWHITPHPQLPAKIIILYACHTHRRIKSKFPNHINSKYLSDIYEQIIHHFSYVGFVLSHKRLCYHGGLKTVHLKHIDSKSFPSQHGTLTKCWFNAGQRRRRWSNIKTALGQFLVGVVSCYQFSRWY